MDTSSHEDGGTVGAAERFHTMANALGCVLGNIELLRKLPAGDGRSAQALHAAYESALRLQGLLESVRGSQGGGHDPEDIGG